MQKILIFIIVLFATSVYAEHNRYDLNKYNFYFLDLPGVCGTPAEVNKYIEDHEFKATEVSLGRESSSPDGNPVYMITMWANDKGERLATIDIAQGNERCMIFHTFDTTKVENGQLKQWKQ